MNSQNNMKTIYRQVAETLFQLQGDTIQNDTKYYLEFVGWTDKYGEQVVTVIPQVQIPEQDIDTLATRIKADHESGYWVIDNYGGLYHYTMFDEYGSYIDNCIEKQLALLTVGYQTKLFAA